MHHLSYETTISLRQLYIGFLGVLGVIITLIIMIVQAKNNDTRMNEHMLNLHRQLTIDRAALLALKLQGEKQDELLGLIDRTTVDLNAYLIKMGIK